jgi:hypothetical protein
VLWAKLYARIACDATGPIVMLRHSLRRPDAPQTTHRPSLRRKMSRYAQVSGPAQGNGQIVLPHHFARLTGGSTRHATETPH